MPGTNWAGTLTYSSERLVAPNTVAEAQEAVRGAARLRVVGSHHCFNDIADTPGLHLSLERMRGVVRLDTIHHRVTVEGGARYSDISPWLHERGYALHNLASLPHITIAGACATATHGSGPRLGNLATAVAAIEFIDARGELVSLSREKEGDVFPGAVVSLGALGVITALTLDLRPSFAMRQDVYCDLPLDTLTANFDEIMGAGYSVSLFTNWQGAAIDLVWIKSRAETGSPFSGIRPFFGAEPATDKLNPVPTASPVNCTDQMGSIGPPYDRLPHFRIDAMPSAGGEVQAEYFVAAGDAAGAIAALGQMGQRPLTAAARLGNPRHRRRRSVAQPLLWAALRCLPLHLQAQNRRPSSSCSPAMEEVLAPFAPVPHWGKLFAMDPATVRSRYAKLDAFKDLLDAHDPAGKFRNAFVERMIFGHN